MPIISKRPLLFGAPTVRSLAATQKQQSRERQQCPGAVLTLPRRACDPWPRLRTVECKSAILGASKDLPLSSSRQSQRVRLHMLRQD